MRARVPEKKRPRPRHPHPDKKWANNAEKQKAYRDRKQAYADIADNVDPREIIERLGLSRDKLVAVMLAKLMSEYEDPDTPISSVKSALEWLHQMLETEARDEEVKDVAELEAVQAIRDLLAR